MKKNEQLIKTLTGLREQINKLAKLKIEDAAKQIDTYVKIVEQEQKRRSK
jgi:hypothetical protein